MPQSIHPAYPAVYPATENPVDALAQLEALIGGSTDDANTKFVEPMYRFAEEPEPSENLRLRILRVFQEQTPLRLQNIEQAIADGDWNLVAIFVHGVKGSVGQIYPASDLVSLSDRLEHMADVLALDDFYSGFAPWKIQVECCLQSVANEIDSNASNANHSNNGVSPPLDNALLAELTELLIQRDFRASDVASKLAPCFLHTEQRPIWLKIDSAIGRYDFKSALDALGDLRTKEGDIC